MPKLKTKSGAKKRFKVTATGKVMAAQRGKRHGMIKRTKKQIRQLRGTRVLFKTDGDNIKKEWTPHTRKSPSTTVPLSLAEPRPRGDPPGMSAAPPGPLVLGLRGHCGDFSCDFYVRALAH